MPLEACRYITKASPPPPDDDDEPFDQLAASMHARVAYGWLQAGLQLLRVSHRLRRPQTASTAISA